MLPICQVFEIHARKNKRHLHFNFQQTAQLCVTHPMFFLGVPEDPLDSLLAPLINGRGISECAYNPPPAPCTIPKYVG